MKSRTNIHQELMRQQIIEEEKNASHSKYNAKSISLNKLTKLSQNNKIIITKNDNQNAKSFIITNPTNLNKRQRSASYTLSTELKSEPFSPKAKSPMDYAFNELGNEDALDWNQIEPSITTTSDISAQEILEQMRRNDRNSSEVTITQMSHQSSRPIDLTLPNQIQYQISHATTNNNNNNNASSAFLLKSSTSCPANMTTPFISAFNNPSEPTTAILINYHNNNNNNNTTNSNALTQLTANNINHNNTTPAISIIQSNLNSKFIQSNNINSANSTSSRTTPNSSSVPSNVTEDQKLQWVRDRNKKDCHNRIERKRRDYINNQIQELGNLLPEKLFLNTESKRNKGGILKNSVIYIHHMSQAVNTLPHLQKETQIAETTITQLYKQNQYLQELLTKSGVSLENEAPTNNEEISGLLQDWMRLHQNNSKLLQSLNNDIQSNWDPDAPQKSNFHIKEEAVSIDSVLNYNAAISRAQTISGSSNNSGTTGTTPSATNFNSPSASGGGLQSSSQQQQQQQQQQPAVGNQKRLQSTNSARTKVLITEPQHTLFIGQSGIKQVSTSFTDNPVLSSILVGGSCSSSTIEQQQQSQNHNSINKNATSHNIVIQTSKHNNIYSNNNNSHSNSATNLEQNFGLSNSVPDHQLRHSFLAQSSSTDNNERYYIIPLSKPSTMNRTNVQFISNPNKRSCAQMDDDYYDRSGGDGDQDDDQELTDIIDMDGVTRGRFGDSGIDDDQLIANHTRGGFSRALRIVDDNNAEDDDELEDDEYDDDSNSINISSSVCGVGATNMQSSGKTQFNISKELVRHSHSVIYTDDFDDGQFNSEDAIMNDFELDEIEME